MAEYKNGVNAFGNMSVGKDDRVAEVKTGRAVFVDDDKYDEDPEYKLKVDKCLAEGFHRVGSSEGGGGGDFSIAHVTVINHTAAHVADVFNIDEHDVLTVNTFIPAGSVDNPSISQHNVVLYKCLSDFSIDADSLIYEVTGSASVDGIVVITGDCTIDISQEGGR